MQGRLKYSLFGQVAAGLAGGPSAPCDGESEPHMSHLLPVS